MTESTGDRVVDGVVERLDDLDRHDVDEHPALFEEVHRRLSEVLQVGEAGRAGGEQD